VSFFVASWQQLSGQRRSALAQPAGRAECPHMLAGEAVYTELGCEGREVRHPPPVYLRLSIAFMTPKYAATQVNLAEQVLCEKSSKQRSTDLHIPGPKEQQTHVTVTSRRHGLPCCKLHQCSLVRKHSPIKIAGLARMRSCPGSLAVSVLHGLHIYHQVPRQTGELGLRKRIKRE